MRIQIRLFLGVAVLSLVSAGYLMALQAPPSSVMAPNTALATDDADVQRHTEQAVERYVRTSMSGQGFYKPFGFGEVQIRVPKELAKLSELQERKQIMVRQGEPQYGASLDSLLAVQDSLIARQQKLIAEKHIANNYSISHVFSIAHSGTSTYTIYECEFFLSSHFNVRDLEIKMDLEADTETYDWFYFYFMRYPLFSSGTERENTRRSTAIYDYFNARLGQEDVDKNALMKSILTVVRTTRRFGEYDPDRVARLVLSEQMMANRLDFQGYKPLEFSPLNALLEKTSTDTTVAADSLVGYSFFHSYDFRTETGKDTIQCVYVEFDPYFVIAGMALVDPPFEQYFRKEEGKE